MTRIAFYMPYFSVGGAEKATLWMARELQRRGYDIRIIVDRRGGALEPAFAATFSIRYLDAARTALAGPKLTSAVREEAPDILVPVMTHNILTAALMKTLGFIKPTLIGWEHSVLSVMCAPRGPRGMIETHAIRSLYSACDKIICVSRGAAADAERLCAPQRITTAYVYNPVPAPVIGTLTPAEKAIVSRLRSPCIVSLGRLNAAKDYTTLLRAFQYFARTNGAGSLLLIGGGEERGALEVAATGFGLGERVVFAGEVANPANLLARADLFVSSSRTESFGIAIVEAMSLGLPIVATDCPTAPREVLSDGRYGRLVPVGDARQIARAMREALAAPQEREAQKARAAEFSVARAADAFLDALGMEGSEKKAAA